LSQRVTEKRKILLVSRGRPDIVAGGGELAACQLHQSLQRSQNWESVVFTRHAEIERTRAGTALSGTGRDSEILFYSTMSDWFRFSQPEKSRVWKEFREVIEVCQPDVVHFHHYLHLGVEMIREVHDFNPVIPIVMTLHEYSAICHNHGKMVRTTDQSRCNRATPADCAACFPEYSAQDFYSRQRFFQSFFSLVDGFIAPSRFLADRYIKWGLPSGKVHSFSATAAMTDHCDLYHSVLTAAGSDTAQSLRAA